LSIELEERRKALTRRSRSAGAADINQRRRMFGYSEIPAEHLVYIGKM